MDSEVTVLENCIAGIVRRDSGALENLYVLTKASVYGFALSILKNTYDAQDVLHDCYIAVWNSASSYTPFGKPLAWIITITRNLCMTVIRRQGKNTDASEDELNGFIDASQTLTEEDRFVIRECLRLVSDTEREIIVLHIVAGFKHREIAALLNIPLSSVLSKYNRALKKLRKSLLDGSDGNE